MKKELLRRYNQINDKLGDLGNNKYLEMELEYLEMRLEEYGYDISKSVNYKEDDYMIGEYRYFFDDDGYEGTYDYNY